MADASFKKEFLETHNAYRAQHSTKPLTYNGELNAAAQKWADHLLSISSLGHSDTKDGENVYNMWSSTPLNLTGKEAVDSWYSEIKDYNWGSPGFNGNTGHFTQVVWAESTELGVGLATDGNKVFVVGQYRPAGNMNMPGYFEKNVQTKDGFPGDLLPNLTISELLDRTAYTHWPHEAGHCPAPGGTQGPLHQEEPRDHCTSVRSDNPSEDCIPVPNSSQVTVGNDMECEPAVIYEENGAPMANLTILVFSVKCQSSCTVLGCEHRQTSGKHSEPAFITTRTANTMADASFKKEFLETHNAYRAQHGAKPLTYNDGLNAAAQKWADHLLSISSMGHSDTKDGENVYNMWSSAPLNLTGKEAVDSWYSEIKDYNWGSPGFNGNTGHFTQVVWAESTELGVGLATDGNKVFVVGQYRPAGNMNMPGYFAKNVQTKDAKQFPPGREVDGADNTASEKTGASPMKTCTLL
ncbi:uncharacterized protein LOC133978798 [Scomber scombrus]|uniref:uncharacterized protein LOC133978798 n=1 Tax=Scomber scombrus TaxID=13677 RepID=UPI002DDB2861|nr:uncharacterized protein LOC133978798 [Scomber scombrus]